MIGTRPKTMTESINCTTACSPVPHHLLQQKPTKHIIQYNVKTCQNGLPSDAPTFCSCIPRGLTVLLQLNRHAFILHLYRIYFHLV
jgi:hypothetical protein